MVKLLELGARLRHFVVSRFARQLSRLAGQQHGSGLRVGPVGAQRLDHGGQHQALNIGARRVVRA